MIVKSRCGKLWGPTALYLVGGGSVFFVLFFCIIEKKCFFFQTEKKIISLARQTEHLVVFLTKKSCFWSSRKHIICVKISAKISPLVNQMYPSAIGNCICICYHCNISSIFVIIQGSSAFWKPILIQLTNIFNFAK